MNIFGNKKNSKLASGDFPQVQYKIQPQVPIIYQEPIIFPVNNNIPLLPVIGNPIINHPHNQLQTQSQTQLQNQFQNQNQIQHQLPAYNPEVVTGQLIDYQNNNPVVIEIENQNNIRSTMVNNQTTQFFPSAPPLNIAMGTVISTNNNTVPLENHYRELKIIQDDIKYQLEHLFLKNNIIVTDNLTINISNITTLEFKKLQEVDKMVYLLKLLVTIESDTIECCHIRVTKRSNNVSNYKIERLLTDMRFTDELGFLDK